ncbi:MAG: bifunctional glutamate N-acetyltransferase/amino-acid acetyltransferase ArgJ [Armatimonadota bacterium]|nr:bifunctional glutamate N-acetyltransferase/amino-acid acetyltransferase ArgJ [Armatimonadota bacterium]MDR5676161.1 bifunctional glutamate N-acetyltransferase/amino-acid acetyltransferase ArgJ [Armatimonadota bacterium]MDR5689954.1 bifunctional glutamate N-acetyltransferase/amino-acid acetyltransferase ArgJ [Armatimonadota bacterium]MDR7387296.1 bifunctional glutamate N-acetyltransferase/amino-acid acetyltransferase ArgJ [Armatimonadota bacterium]MDR7390129.1 bifunctional glutamate N-acetylt
MLTEPLSWQRTSGGVTAPRGYLAAGVHCGIKQRKPDLALLVSESPATVAGVFTTNRIKAAPVRWCQEVVRRGVARAVVVNSGNANACTGDRGWHDAQEMAERTAQALGIPAEQVLVASTGVIGVPLPMEALRRGIPLAVRSLSRSGDQAAEAILTTDAFPKTSAAVTTVGGVQVTVGGMAKGAGMIHPRLATTLCFLTTDAAVPAPVLRRALEHAVDESFNRITVDGDTSTNDTVLVLANGQAQAPPVEGGEDLDRFTEALTAVAQDLARMVVRDGEGAQRLVEVVVEGARDQADAERAAFAVATSLLVKTMLHGGEPNWGRVVAAVGYSGAEVDERRVAVWFGDVQVVHGGVGVEGVFDRAAQALRRPEVLLRVDLGLGPGRARVWTCDLGEEYVRINGSYIT